MTTRGLSSRILTARVMRAARVFSRRASGKWRLSRHFKSRWWPATSDSATRCSGRLVRSIDEWSPTLPRAWLAWGVGREDGTYVPPGDAEGIYREQSAVGLSGVPSI